MGTPQRDSAHSWGERRGWGHSGGASGKVRRLRKLVRGQGHTLRGVWAAGEALGSVLSIRYCVTFAR